MYTKVCVKMPNLENNLEFIWPRDRFIRRIYLMQEMYQNFAEGEEWQLPDVRWIWKGGESLFFVKFIIRMNFFLKADMNI